MQTTKKLWIIVLAALAGTGCAVESAGGSGTAGGGGGATTSESATATASTTDTGVSADTCEALAATVFDTCDSNPADGVPCGTCSKEGMFCDLSESCTGGDNFYLVLQCWCKEGKWICHIGDGGCPDDPVGAGGGGAGGGGAGGGGAGGGGAGGGAGGPGGAGGG